MKKIIRRIKMWYWKRFCPSKYFYEITKEAMAKVTASMTAAAEALRGFNANIKIDLPASNKGEETARDIPAIQRGDIVRVESCHSLEPHFYEVYQITDDGVVSQPACFHHRYNEITAVYRYDGKHFACVWEG